MTNPYVELQKLLVPKTGFKEFGSVTYVDEAKVHVSVNGRPKIYSRDGARYSKGDEVVIQGDVLIGRKNVASRVRIVEV